jgi:hypothetical protein
VILVIMNIINLISCMELQLSVPSPTLIAPLLPLTPLPLPVHPPHLPCWLAVIINLPYVNVRNHYSCVLKFHFPKSPAVLNPALVFR